MISFKRMYIYKDKPHTQRIYEKWKERERGKKQREKHIERYYKICKGMIKIATVQRRRKNSDRKKTNERKKQHTTKLLMDGSVHVTLKCTVHT